VDRLRDKLFATEHFPPSTKEREGWGTRRIAAHSHRDDRVATVISGTWRIGYGDKFDEASLKALPPGSFYTEPAGGTHFAATADEAVVVQITGFGPSSTDYVVPTQDPRQPRTSE
jgi:uncharacterized RmlC-like cupin family protein